MSSQAAAACGVVLLSSLAIWLFVATRRTSSEIGRNAYGFGGNLRQRATQILFRVSTVVVVVALFLHALDPAIAAVVPMIEIDPTIRILLLMFASAGAALTLFARSEMGRRWRIGVPGEAPDGLVTQGLFAYSRNPVFVGMIAVALGLATAVPSPSALLAAAAFVFACNMQVTDEERFLAAAFGDEYDSYRAAVRRWV
ncbi:methyltransferase family protein [Pararhizobium haloflavum]|uniref:methyltransferase family protein n=1 Tax=Pararhizobium haloflavum TaxID=2037914 RepID=UPI000C182F9B|nr:isoprenylcysteine carboxylmethyltransferase family protein [Pararhizobium haloflavum]